uniref:ATP-dependent Clp protease ATP-binding subunit clpX-like, mitochondrial n=1 Tax=Haemonchus contortus TaxID=6289 RepID=A0A7I4XZN5_HAECO|nr:ATPase associated with various cellular activities and Clp ATPase domain containing protein [Haemonchus contortus]
MHRSASLLLHACRTSACKQIQRGVRMSCPAQCTTSGDGSGDSDLPTNPPKTAPALGPCKECGFPLKPAPTLTPTTRYIHCDNCNKLYAGNIIEESSKQWTVKIEQRRSPPYPSQIAEYLDRFVVGQKQAKKTLAVGVYQHYRRLEHNIESGAASIHQIKEDVKNTPRGVLYQDENRLGHIATSELRSSPITSAYMQQVPSMQTPPAKRAPPVFRAIPDKEPVVRLEKSNILLIGPSGVGKTFLTQTLARILDVPIALCDCTSMTQAGYVGEDVESVIQKLVQAAGGNAEKAQQGIVFLDEVDKIAAAHEGHSPAYRDVSGEGVQHALLKLVEGTVVNVKSGRKSVGAQQDTVQVDTSDILFVASGAFNNLDKIVARRLDKKSLGFGSSSGELRVTADDANSEQARKRDYLLSKADQGDLINFGIVPELVGRFPVLVPFHSFDQDMLVRVLTEPQNSLLTQLKLQFAIDNVDLSFSSEALQQVAQLALERKTGARALRSILEGVLLDAKFTVPGSDIESIHVTREAVLGEAEVEYTRRVVENKQAVSAM